MGPKSPARGECGPCAGRPGVLPRCGVRLFSPKPAPAAASFPGIKGDSAKRGGAPKRPPRRESPLIPPRFRPAAVRPESRHPSCPPRGFQRKRKRRRPMRPPRRAVATPAFRGRFEERAASFPLPGGRRFFLPRFAPVPEKSPGAGVDGPPALFEKGMLIDAQEHRDVLVPHGFRHAFDVRPVHKRQRGEGVTQVIRA